MTFKIVDGREYFYQWDLNRQIIVDDPTISEVHFCNRLDNCSLVVRVVNGIANVPNILLQKSFDIRVFAYDGEATLFDRVFEVKARTQPSDYVYTETDVLSVKQLEEELRKDIDERLAGLEQEVENGLLADGFATKEYVEEAINNIEIPEDTEVIEVDFGSMNFTKLNNEVATKIAANPDKYAIKVTWSSKDIKGVYYTFSKLEHLDASSSYSFPASDNIYYSALTETGYTAYPEITASTLRFYIEYKSDNTTVDKVGAYITTKTINSGSGGDADLTNYYTKAEVDELIPDTSSFITEVPAEYITETELNNKGYLTEHQSLTDYAKKSELFSKDYNDLNNKPTIPSIEGLATEQYVNDAIANIDIPESGGGSAEGAVSYLEAQDLTEEQKNQAKENISAPYIVNEKTESGKITKSAIPPAATTSIQFYLSSGPFKAIRAQGTGATFWLKVEGTNLKISEEVECRLTSSSKCEIVTDTTNLVFFSKISSISDTYIYLDKKDTSAYYSGSDSVVLTIYYSAPIAKNRLDKSLISGLDDLKLITDSSKVGLIIQEPNPSYPLKDVSTHGVVIGSNCNINNAGYLNCLGYNNKVAANVSHTNILGSQNAAQYTSSTSVSGNAPVSYMNIFGYQLRCTQNTAGGTVLGKYNDTTSKYLPYSNSTTYNTGDCVTTNATNFSASVWRCLQNGVKGKQPSFGSTTGNEYWEYVDDGSSSSYLLTLGNGNDSGWPVVRSNAFTVDYLGNVVAAGTVSPTGADYAEYFEFEDGNPNREDRIGYLVELSGAKIKLANGTDILGAVSSTMGVIGDAEEMNWHGKYERDEFGRTLFETVEVEREVINDAGETEKITEFVTTKKLSKEYDPNRHYAPRSDRPEWAPIGLLGKLLVRHDGTLSTGDYVKAINGIASKSEEKTNIRVLEVVSENVIRVLIK